MAPEDLPQGGTIQVTATSHADSTKSSSASVTVSSDVGISVSPASSAVELGSILGFHASITSGGHPDTTVHWSLSGSACPAQCGTIDGNGNYTAPQILPSAAIVSITATSVADPSRQSSASITITSNFTLRIAAPASLASGVSSAIVATMTPVAGSQPNANLSWSLCRRRLQRFRLRHAYRHYHAIRGREPHLRHGKLCRAIAGAPTRYRFHHGHTASRSQQKGASDGHHPRWNGNQPFSHYRDHRRQSAVRADRFGERPDEHGAQLDRQWNRRRQCDLRTDLCNRFQSLPSCDQQQRFTGGLSGAGSDSLAKSVFDRGQ